MINGKERHIPADHPPALAVPEPEQQKPTVEDYTRKLTMIMKQSQVPKDAIQEILKKLK